MTQHCVTFRYIRSLQHSVAWGALGGKSGSAFYKSLGEYSFKISEDFSSFVVPGSHKNKTRTRS